MLPKKHPKIKRTTIDTSGEDDTSFSQVVTFTPRVSSYHFNLAEILTTELSERMTQGVSFFLRKDGSINGDLILTAVGKKHFASQ